MNCAGIIVSDIKNKYSMASFKQCVSILRHSCVKVLCEDSICEYLDCLTPFERSDIKPEVLFTIGGDGTLLRGIQYAIEYHSPVLGINHGSLGFLTEIPPDKLQQAIASVIEGHFNIDERPMMSVDLNDCPQTWYSLNDAVITRGGYSRLITVSAYCNTDLIESFKADGVVISTPTGSTGYSFSAGGPIVYPSVKCLIITPVCAHTMRKFPCIVPFNSEITIKLHDDISQSAILQTDGQTKGMLKNTSSVRIKMSETKIELIRLEKQSYFETVRQKLNDTCIASEK